MDNNQETFDTWNNLASVYQDKFMNLDLYNETYDYICKAVIKPQAKLLEIGCGPGNITKYLLSKRPDFDIFGIDIAPNMIERAKANNPAASFAVMDTRDIKSLDTKYDAIIGGFCLPYLSQSESDELISQSYVMLNAEGLIYLSFVEGEPAQSGFKTCGYGRVYFNYHNLDNLKAQLTKTGFGAIETFKVPYKTSVTEFDIHTILVAKKKTNIDTL
ncbi:class I SAM-dependent methyltransferase [Niabella sp. 22666]|uniref:class I SAM-dependent methyltransferase n=1 Tax=Niabella sp. 22666 TaxID=3453954 RepID=UPI003F829976